MSDRFRLDTRVAVVTGGGTGIGRASALLLAAYGADVVLAGRRPGPLGETAEEIEALGRRALAVPTDVSCAKECRELIDAATTAFGRLDVLVNCAGGGPTKSPLKWTDDEWDDILALNLGSVFHLSRAAAGPMLAQGSGSIVNISSGASLLAMPQAAPYGAAKAAVNNLTGSLAAAWTRKGVRVNCVAVGAVRAATLVDEAERQGVDLGTIAATNGSGRLGEPDEIAHAVLFFASDASGFCSGQTLYVHGGPGLAGV
ncbi:SDR family NAD(P)-dependent oxidoreductase [Streptomyces sp. NPDC004629]|uniref:SDR family NAD(P)-dependent oxidoreductase n=1 Tax=Streptomyces sp. NPDC004629 TaxID=3364705 RepID=UPI0036B1BE83